MQRGLLSGRRDTDSIPMKERMKGSGRGGGSKVVVLCNTRDEERWRDEAGRVWGGGCLRVHVRIAVRSFESQINVEPGFPPSEPQRRLSSID